MSVMKNQALEILNRLHSENRIDYADYSAIHDGLNEMDTLRDRDMELEELWAEFADVPIDPCSEKLEDLFMHFPAGTDRETVWHWFDRRHSKGIGYLLYRDGIDRTDQFSRMVYLKQLCDECESQTCQYNHGGECRFALVHERKPRITEDDGCIDYDYQEGEA